MSVLMKVHRLLQTWDVNHPYKNSRLGKIHQEE